MRIEKGAIWWGEPAGEWRGKREGSGRGVNISKVHFTLRYTPTYIYEDSIIKPLNIV
jgi:hypothetical protein